MHDREQQQRPTWPPTWSEEAKSFYKIGIPGMGRADKRDFKKGPQLHEEARVVAARLHHASGELQLRIESRRFEIAQVQLQVQAEKTATAKAQLAVEKARNRGRQLDIELELKKAGSTAAKSEADAARSAARLLDLDKQAALAAVKKEAAQLQLDGQQQRALNFRCRPAMGAAADGPCLHRTADSPPS